MPTKVNFVNIPQELKANASFCLWKLEKRNGKATKVPYNPRTGGLAKTNDAKTFSDFVTAMKDYAMGGWDGIGYRGATREDRSGVGDGTGARCGDGTGARCVDGANGSGVGCVDGAGYVDGCSIGAIDIDHCIREDGSLNDVAASILGFFPETYFERSPSGTGLRGFFFLPPDFAYDKTVYYINNRKYGLEVYLPGATNRFVTVTGDVYRPGSVVRDDAALTSVLDTFMKRPARMENTSISAPCSYLTDEQVIKHASASESGEKFTALYKGSWQELYDSQSDADMAFVSMLAFWCGNVEEQIDRIFRTSGLMRDKWDRRTGDSTYGQITIRNVVNSNSTVYTPVLNAEPTSAEDDFGDLDYIESTANGIANGTEGGTEGGTNGRTEGGTAGEQRPSFRPALSFVTLTIDAMQPHTNPRYGHGEIGIGNIFADYYKPIARFNASRDIWYVYDGCVWRPDENELAVFELSKSLADKLLIFALQIKDEDTRTRYIKNVQKLQFRKNRRTMIEDAKSVYPVAMDIFDRDHYLFNCRNGTLDLRILQFREHDPKDFITKSSPVRYDPNASCPRWNQFISEVMQGREDVARYLQKAIGYAMTGDTSLECLFIMYGPKTRNGKTTTIETILRVMGEYGRSAKPDMLASNFRTGTSNNGPSEDVARLAGARFVGISEMEQKLTINASLTKQLTGNDSITARFLHENSFEFHLQAKIFIDTNHLPNVTDQTLFESGRIKIIPFERHFEDYEQDKGLKGKLIEERNLSGILNWCVEGYRLFKVEGLEEPKAVKVATAQYREDNDRFEQFAAAWLEQGYDENHFMYEVSTMAAYRVYTQWAESMNFRAENFKNFRAAMEKLYSVELKRPRDGGNMISMIVGARLRKEEAGTEEGGQAFKKLDDEDCVIV